MEDWRLLVFAAFMVVILGAGYLISRRRRRAQMTGTDPVYAVASLGEGALERQAANPRERGIGTTGE